MPNDFTKRSDYQTINNAIHEVFRTGKVAKSLHELKSSVNNRPLSLYGPLNDVFESTLFQKVVQDPKFAEAESILEAMGHNLDYKTPSLPALLQNTLSSLNNLANLGEVDSCCTPSSTPKIESFEEFVDSMDGCPLLKGKTLRGASPGAFIRIRGNGFSLEPSKNIVKFGDTRACVLKSDSTSIVVQVPLPGILSSSKDVEFLKGKTVLTVSTPHGITTADFEIMSFSNVDERSFEEYVKTVQRIYAKLNGRLSIHSNMLGHLSRFEETGSLDSLLKEFPMLLSRTIKGYDFLLSISNSFVTETSKKVLNGIISSSGIINELKSVEAQLDDPLTQVWSGSGIVDAICYVEHLVLKLIIITIQIIIVLLVVLFILCLFAGPLGGPLLFIVVIGLTFEYVLAVIAFELAVLEIVTIIYAIAKAIEGLVDWVKGLFD